MQQTHIRKTPEKKNSFFSGVFILTLANIIVKVIGLFFKIPISHILGDEGMGYFNAAYTIYTWLYMLSTAGFPVAISILVAKEVANGRQGGAKRIGRISMAILSIVGGVLTAVMLFFGKGIANIIGSDNAYYAILFIAPTLLLVCISSALRGYYQGYGTMHPTAFSQIFEAAGKLIIGVFFALYAQRKGYPLPMVAAFSILGVTVGTFFSMAYLLVAKPNAACFSQNGALEEKRTPWFHSMLSLLKIAVPVTLGATVMSLTNVIDLGMIMRRLQSIGYSPSEAAALYGNYTTLVVPMFNLPSVFVNSIAYAIVPAISGALAKEKRDESDRLGKTSLAYTTLIAIPCALGIGVFSYSILSTVFPEQSARLAAPYLTMISPGIVFICILAVTNSILQAYGHPRLPILSLLAGGLVKILVGYFLIGDKRFGMAGAPIGTVLCYFVASFLNLLFIFKKTNIRVGLGTFFIKPLWAGVLSVGCALCFDFATANMLQNIVRLLLSVVIAVVIYAILAWKMKLIVMDDILKIPSAERFLSLFHKGKRKKHTTNW